MSDGSLDALRGLAALILATLSLGFFSAAKGLLQQHRVDKILNRDD